MFNLEIPAWTIVFRTVTVYLVLLIGLRISGKREIGQITLIDLVVLLLLANSVQNAMTGPDTSLTGGIIAAIVLLSINWLIAQVRYRSARFRRLIDGSPSLLVLHGKVMKRQMAREGIDPETLEAALREHGVTEFREVEMAVLETDGSISVVPVGDQTKIIHRPLQFLKK